MPRTSSPASRTRRRPWAVELGDHRVHQGARDVHQAPRRAKRRALDHAAAVAETERKLEASDNLEIDLEGRSLEKPPLGEKNGFAQIVSRANSPAGVNRAARSSPVDLSHASVRLPSCRSTLVMAERFQAFVDELRLTEPSIHSLGGFFLNGDAMRAIFEKFQSGGCSVLTTTIAQVSRVPWGVGGVRRAWGAHPGCLGPAVLAGSRLRRWRFRRRHFLFP